MSRLTHVVLGLALGMGLVVPPVRLDESRLRAADERVRNDPGFRRNACRIRDAIARSGPGGEPIRWSQRVPHQLRRTCRTQDDLRRSKPGVRRG